MISVFAVMTAKEGKKQQVLDIARSILEKVRAEKGCHVYRLVEDVQANLPFQKKLGADSFAFVEEWESLEALEAHLITPHMKDYAEKTADLLWDSDIYVMQSADE